MPAGRPKMYNMPEFEAFLDGRVHYMTKRTMVRLVSQMLNRAGRRPKLCEMKTIVWHFAAKRKIAKQAWNYYAAMKGIPEFTDRIKPNRFVSAFDDQALSAISILMERADCSIGELCSLSLANIKLLRGNGSTALKIKLNQPERLVYIPLDLNFRPDAMLFQLIGSAQKRAFDNHQQPGFILSKRGEQPTEDQIVEWLLTLFIPARPALVTPNPAEQISALSEDALSERPIDAAVRRFAQGKISAADLIREVRQQNQEEELDPDLDFSPESE